MLRTLLRRILEIAITFVGFSLFNALAARFEIESGVSILFPATAVAILSCMAFGMTAAIGVILGTVATPWGPVLSPGLLVVSGILTATEGMIPCLLFRLRSDLSRDLRDMKSLSAFLLFGTILNTALSAVSGNLLLVPHPPGVWLRWREVFIWWIADFSAALLIATPVLAFGGALAARWGAEGRGTRPRTITNTLQIVTVVILLGFAASFAVRTHLLNHIERERLAQQKAWSEAELLLNQMQEAFSRGSFIAANDPKGASKLDAARRANAQAIRRLTPLFRTPPALAGTFNRVAAETGGWLQRPDEARRESTAHAIAADIATLHRMLDSANAEAWTAFAVKRERIMFVASMMDALVFLILLLAAATLLLRVSLPFARIRDAIEAMREGKTPDASLIDSPYAEFRSIAETLEETASTLRRREEELRTQTHRAIAASQHKSEFLAKMSHELRTPLNSIIGFSDLLIEQETTIDAHKRGAFLENVSTSARHLLTLINDLLDIAKVESGKMQLHLEPVDLRLAIANTVASTSPLFARKHQQVEVSMPATPMVARADISRVEQVLLNLLSNANKFSSEGDKITIRSHEEGRDWKIDVIDRGIGIARGDQERIFEEFEQLHPRGPNSIGTGLGLALARRFVEAHGGSLVVKSTLGSGATFTVTLPREEVVTTAAS